MRKRGQNAQIQRSEHGHRGSRDKAEAVIEQQQIQHDERKADARDEHARSQRVLAQGGTDRLALREFEAHRQRTGFEHGLHAFRLIERIAARDRNVAVGNFALHGRSGLHHAVEDDHDLALGGGELLGGLGEGGCALGIELQVDRVVGRGLAGLAHRDAFNIVARDDRRIGALFDVQRQLLLARGELVAHGIGDAFLLHILAGFDLGTHLFVGERVEASELELARLADRGEGFLRIGKAGNLNQNLVGTLQSDGRLGCAERVNATLDNGARLLHVFGGDSGAVFALCGKNHRQTALDVKALVDLLLRGREHEHRTDDEQRGDDKQPHVTTVHMLRCFPPLLR